MFVAVLIKHGGRFIVNEANFPGILILRPDFRTDFRPLRAYNNYFHFFFLFKLFFLTDFYPVFIWNYDIFIRNTIILILFLNAPSITLKSMQVFSKLKKFQLRLSVSFSGRKPTKPGKYKFKTNIQWEFSEDLQLLRLFVWWIFNHFFLNRFWHLFSIYAWIKKQTLK